MYYINKYRQDDFPVSRGTLAHFVWDGCDIIDQCVKGEAQLKETKTTTGDPSFEWYLNPISTE